MIIDAEGLILTAKQKNRKQFETLVARYRARGASDRELVQAMASARTLIDPCGPVGPNSLARPLVADPLLLLSSGLDSVESL